eukprot:999210-Alexandrium_andersonii.AAC.1
MVEAKEPVHASSWSELSRLLKVDYWGAEVTRAYPLTLKQVLPALPPLGVAAVARLEDHLSPESREVLLDPARLLRPAAEVETPLPRARVQVGSQQEYEGIIQCLLERGIVEPEVPSETFRHRGRQVYNG